MTDCLTNGARGTLNELNFRQTTVSNGMDRLAIERWEDEGGRALGPTEAFRPEPHRLAIPDRTDAPSYARRSAPERARSCTRTATRAPGRAGAGPVVLGRGACPAGSTCLEANIPMRGKAPPRFTFAFFLAPSRYDGGVA
jgi:hypothetical protein